ATNLAALDNARASLHTTAAAGAALRTQAPARASSSRPAAAASDADYTFIHFVLAPLPSGPLGPLIARIPCSATAATASAASSFSSVTTPWGRPRILRKACVTRTRRRKPCGPAPRKPGVARGPPLAPGGERTHAKRSSPMARLILILSVLLATLGVMRIGLG